MKFVCAPPEIAESEIVAAINKALETSSVLLLVSGGSNIQLAVKIRNRLAIKHRLTIGLIDERYGPVGHPNSNWTQLIDAGLDLSDISALPVLIDNQPHSQTAENYMKQLESAVREHNQVIGIFGLGADGHTAGILPGSSAITATTIIAAFQGSDFPRITITPAAMEFFDEAYLVSYGKDKHAQLSNLDNTIPVTEQPVQALKRIENVTVYSDYGGLGK